MVTAYRNRLSRLRHCARRQGPLVQYEALDLAVRRDLAIDLRNLGSQNPTCPPSPPSPLSFVANPNTVPLCLQPCRLSLLPYMTHWSLYHQSRFPPFLPFCHHFYSLLPQQRPWSSQLASQWRLKVTTTLAVIMASESRHHLMRSESLCEVSFLSNQDSIVDIYGVDCT